MFRSRAFLAHASPPRGRLPPTVKRHTRRHKARASACPARAACKPARQSGASLIEFSVVSVPILLLGLGSIEITQWFFHKQAVSLALLEAGRAAITQHANPATIEAAFEHGLLPLVPATKANTARQRLDAALNQRRQATGAAPWRIEVISPPASAFTDFHDPSLSIMQQTGLPAINNNYIAEQDQRKRSQGWPDGRGPESGMTILQANTLVLRLTYLHEPVLPGMKGLIRKLGTPNKSYATHAMALGGYLPIVQDVALVMQSHPVNWPLPSRNGKIVGQQAQPHTAAAPAPSCHGLWCLNHPQAAVHTASPSPSAGAEAPTASARPSTPSVTAQRVESPPWGHGNNVGGLTTAPDDPACGVILCCG
ncbi:pilus assembly protein [Candidimonas sp. SYP-B2681]|uniref:TadE/TadG family type IV pilus assembly protein n=1 Tax=Candidimonas sp. SYP-B2681 TaxID=2497686 RepID=UPI000F8954A5|nr:TadE/TadG family type IV pilus assembly protein [Candidimonas sp. SYP-B2681]RTZ42529.1 pilus assembly protein [Candidimonas sp. SYP-B2681]